MRLLIAPALFALLSPLIACGGGDEAGTMFAHSECNDGLDNDGDGATDFPDDLSCASESGDDESALPAPQCKDGRDNDGDGKIDYPSDPGCWAPHQDDEYDDCPDGPGCPQCSDGKDNDGNGQTDWPSDSLGCMSASDDDEYTRNLTACGSNVKIDPLPFDGTAMGTLSNMGASSLVSPMCGGAGVEAVYELRLTGPKVIVATTDFADTTSDTVLYIRGADCHNNASDLACNNDISTSNKKSTVTYSAPKAGTYYLVVDAKDAASAGAYKVNVRYLTGEGETCSGADDCGPGLVCRVPANQNAKVCAKHACEDGLDDDGDGKIDFPDDPGCTSKLDDTEDDACPGVGPNCPECGDGFDNDGDGKTDYGPNGDPTCTSASSASEACASLDGVVALTQPSTMDTTVGAVNDVKPACGSSSNTAPDKTYRLDVPAMTELTIDNVNMFDAVVALYNSTCGGTAINCKDEPETLTMTNLAAGTYYYVVDGYSSGSGAYTIKISGKIQNGASCESALAQSGAITCAIGYACTGTMGQRTCQQAQCYDRMDNDGDGKIDFPFDPGCASPGDNDETDPATPPVCSNGVDDDMDMATDFPADFGCVAAGGTSEQFCIGETDPPQGLIATTKTTGTTAMKANDWKPTCGASATATSAAPDAAHALQLPVAVDTLVLDTIGSSFDTVLTVYDAQCNMVVGCDDDGGGSLRSKLTLTNVSPGGYAVLIDGYQTSNGAYTLNVKGTVAAGTPCDSPLFAGGTNAVLVCPTNTTCTGTPKKCQ